MVIGPSDEIFIWWGHAALIVEDAAGNNARVYDWGIFSYPSDSFLSDFVRGRVSYKCAVSPARWDIEAYIREDRDITLYTLDLEAEKKEAILNYADNNVLPENCYYTYHPFRDNCATRIRHLVDIGTGGQFRERFEQTPGRFTLRNHIRRFTWFRPFADGAFSFLMGQYLDKPVSAWEEMFLPVEIGRSMTDFRYIDTSGAERSLVSAVETVNASKNRKPVLEAPILLWPRSLNAGVGMAVLLFLIALLRRRSPLYGRILWGLTQSLLALLLGAAALIPLFLAFVLKHDYVWPNYNLLFINPLILGAVPLGFALMAGRAEAEKYLRLIWAYVCIADLCFFLIRLLPFFYQQNQSVQVLIFPVALVLSGAFARLKPGLYITGHGAFIERRACGTSIENSP
jgi:hypothetical protein